jgi:hypothetical protein
VVRKEIIDIALKFLAELKEQKIAVVEAFLYGSQVKGSAHQWSDIDIAVVCQPFAEDAIEQNMCLWRIAVRIDPRLAPVSFAPEDLEKEYIPIIPEIKKGLALLDIAD